MRASGMVLVLLLAAGAGAGAEDLKSEAEVTNLAPEVVDIDLRDEDDVPTKPGVQIAPAPGETREVEFLVKVRDGNGWRDLDEVEVTVHRPDGSLLDGPIEVERDDGEGTIAEFEGEFELAHHEPPGDYTVHVTAKDRLGDEAEGEDTFTVLELLAFDVDADEVEFASGALEPGGSTHDAAFELRVRNHGNVQIDLRLASTHLQAQGSQFEDAFIPAKAIRYSLDATMADEVALDTETYTDEDFDLAPGTGAEQAAYLDLHVPSGEEQYVPATVYRGTLTLGVVRG